MADRYLVEHARVKKKPRSAREDEKNINRELLPVWGHNKANKISRRDIIALIDGIGKRAPIQVNRILALISKIFNFAIAKEIVEINPAVRLASQAPNVSAIVFSTTRRSKQYNEHSSKRDSKMPRSLNSCF